jgi:hypothetical protein
MRVLRWCMYVAGGSGSYRGLSYASPTTLGYKELAFINGSATPSVTGPTYRSDAVYESVPHACTEKGCGPSLKGSDARRSYIEELELG